jgi:ATP-dependent DNA helicase DinG
MEVPTLIQHIQGIHLKNFLSEHKTKQYATVLMSPSLFEGIDLPNNESRFQIFVKAPYPSLGDKRIKYIFEKYPDIYERITLYKIIQGFGRSTRNKDDHSITYALDSNISRLFYGQSNHWIDEFFIIR